MNRRQFIKLGSLSWVMLQPAMLLAKSPGKGLSKNKKIIWVVLRGAVDSLHALVPTKDAHLMKHRSELVTPILDEVFALENGFALHPKLKTLYKWYTQKEMLPIVAVASPYRERSHFDAQDMLESGLEITNHNSGWLARAINEYHGDALAIARSQPLSLRGSKETRTWYPSALPEVEIDLYDQLHELYANDAELSELFKKGLRTREMLTDTVKAKRNPKFLDLAKSCGQLMSQSPTASCAMLEMGGWDTHRVQVSRLSRQFEMLDNGLAALKEELGMQWQNTVVILATEFGRTVAVNGTKGTDHGTASALFLAGGALQGGHVLGEWPGLAPEKLFEGRDLMPTSDSRAWLAAVLKQHWQLSDAQLQRVFPDVKAMSERLIS